MLIKIFSYLSDMYTYMSYLDIQQEISLFTDKFCYQQLHTNVLRIMQSKQRMLRILIRHQYA